MSDQQTNSVDVADMVYDWGKRQSVPCQCESVSLFCASLIDQPWMQKREHAPATKCNCGQSYYSWSKQQSFEQVKP